VVSRAVLIRNPSATERARGIDFLIAEKGQPIVFQSSSGNSPAGNVFRSSTLAEDRSGNVRPMVAIESKADIERTAPK